MQGDQRGPQRLARWLLSAATAIGLLAMHSLGHGGGPVFHATHAQASMITGPVLAAAEDGCAGDDCAHTGGPAHGGHHLGMSDVCQAIIEVLGLLLLVGLLRFAAAGSRRSRPMGGYSRVGTARPPPRRLVGLTLSTVSVLRI